MNLSSIGGFLGGLGRKVGSGVQQGIHKLGELGVDDTDGQTPPYAPMPRRPIPMTPGINPNAPMPHYGGRGLEGLGGEGRTDVMKRGQRPITGGFAGNEGVPTFEMRTHANGYRSAPGMVQVPQRSNSPLPQPLGQNNPMNPGTGYPMDFVDVKEFFDPIPGQEATRPRVAPQPSPEVNRIQIGDATRIPATQFESPMVARNRPPENINPAQAIPQLNQMDAEIGRTANRPTMMQREAPQAPGPMQGATPYDPSSDSRSSLPIPSLPNRGGKPVPYSPYEAARYDHVQAGQKEDGSGYRRSLKTSLRNGINSAANEYFMDRAAGRQTSLGSLLGGGIAGFGGSLANPQVGLEREYEAGQGRAIMENQARQDAEIQRQRGMESGGLDLEIKRGQLGHIRNQDEIARINADRQVAVAQSTIKYNQARTQAAQRGTPVKVDLYNPEKDVVESVQVYPDGQRRVLGISGDAMIKGATLESQNQRAEADRLSREREGALNRGSRENIAQMPARERGGSGGVPDEARKEFVRVNRLKANADKLFKDAIANPALLEQAYAARDDYNANAEDFGQVYGDYYEVGKGEKDWNYIKEKSRAMGASRPAIGGQPNATPRPTTVPRSYVEAFASEKGISVDEAAKRFAAKGIQVR